jgi:hypothetical protein
MQEITTWLTHKDYLEGVRLYLQHGQDPVLKKLFTSEQRTDYKEQRLEKALREVLRGSEVIKPEERPQLSITMKSWPIEAAKDDVLKALRADWLRKFKELQDLRSQLMLLPNDDQRGETAHQILNLDDECDQIYATRDYYLQNGTLPAMPQEEYVVDSVKAAQRMQLLGRYIRRERFNLKKDPTNVGAAARKQKFIKEYNHYAKRFGVRDIQEATEAETAAKE